MKIKAKLEPGKVAIVTGGSSGIGKAIACGLAERGMHIWLVAQRKDILDSARIEVEAHRKTSGQNINTISADVSNLEQVRKLISQIMNTTGMPDLLVNSAGVAYPGYVEKLDINIFYWMMEVNYFGTVYMTKEVLPAMIARSSGYILNICSFSGIISTFGYTAYGASKYAVHGFSEALRMEMKVHGIGVSIIFPTDTDTPQLAYENQFKPVETRALSSAGGMNTASDIARYAIKGIERGQYYIMPKLDAKLIHLLNSLSPSLVNFIVDMIVANAIKKKIEMEGKKV